MTVQNKTLIALAISASLLAACNKHNELDNQNIQKSDIECIEGNNSRFVSYNTIATVGAATAKSLTKAVSESAPAIPEEAVNMLDIDGNGTKYAAWNAKQGTNYYLPEGEEWTAQLKFADGINYYIEGTLSLNFYGNRSELNILPKGTLKIMGNVSFNSLTVNCWGELDVDPDSQLYFDYYTTFNSYSNSVLKAYSINNQGTFSHSGDMELTNQLSCSGSTDTSFTLGGSLTAYKVQVSNSGKVNIGGNVMVKTDVELSGYSSMTVGASIIAPNRLYVTNNSILDVADYLKCNTLDLDSYSTITTHNETLIECEKIGMFNTTAKIHNVDSDGCTVIKVDYITAQANIDRLSGGGMDLHAPVEEYGKYNWSANVIFNGSTYIPAKGDRPEFGVCPEVSEPVYTLSHIGCIESVDRESVSTTSVDFANDLIYISSHKRGDEHGGYIDVADISSQSILSTLHSTTQDFNSISVLDDQISAVGASANGAIMSNITYSNSAVAATYSYIEGASANSVLRVGESKWVTTNSGITILPENKFIPLERAKYAATAGDKVVILAGTPAASLYIFEQNGELVKSFSCGTISIENGKNTIYADGDRIYVSLGVAGLRSYDLNGNLLNEFTEIGAGAVNGVSADENYIYMACGLSGLYILDKNDFSLIKSYTLNGASANFVKRTSDGLIYVAYGLNGVHIFELLSK